MYFKRPFQVLISLDFFYLLNLLLHNLFVFSMRRYIMLPHLFSPLSISLLVSFNCIIFCNISSSPLPHLFTFPTLLIMQHFVCSSVFSSTHALLCPLLYLLTKNCSCFFFVSNCSGPPNLIVSLFWVASSRYYQIMWSTEVKPFSL